MTYRLNLDANEFSTLRMAVMACAAKIETKLGELSPSQYRVYIALNEELTDLNALRAKIEKVRERAT